MFIKNPSSIKKQVVKVNYNIHKYLLSCGQIPLSFDDGLWIYIDNDTVSSLIEKYEKGGDIDE